MDDEKAFEELVARYQGQVCAVAFSVLRDRARSEEVAQDAFLIAWQKLPAMHPPPQLPAWVCGIARNLARNRARRIQETSMESHAEPATTATALDQLLDQEREQLASRALADLGEHDREAIVLYYRGDSSYAEVATTLGITEAAARQRVHRGRERLRSALATVEASLRATRPSPAFTAACVAALAAGGGASSASAATSAAPSKAWLALPIAAAVIGGGVAVIAGSSSSPSPSPLAPAGAASVHPVDRDARSAPVDATFFRRVEAGRRQTLLDQIRGAQRRRVEQTSTPTLWATTPVLKTYDFSGDVLQAMPSTPAPDPTKLDKRSLRWAIRDVSPLLLECYANAYARLPRKDGTLEIKLTLIGEPGIATQVDEVELGGAPHLVNDEAFAECMRETLRSIEFAAMTEPGTWNVNYPLEMPGVP